ncbi:MAG: hypothetical protein WC323_01450 [Patescibacteria group bacterium]|jgi:hypothetical protein
MPKFKETDNFIVDLRQQAQTKKTEPEKEVILREKKKTFSEQVFEHAREEESQPSRFFKNENEPSFSWLDFVRYNNAFLIIVVVGVIAFGGLSMASEEVRDATIGGKQVYAEGVDNTLLLETDFDNFSMDFKITGIMEDEENYTVTYSYVDMDVKEGAWQIAEKEGGRKISKPFRRDLGLYLAEQLSQEAKARIKELKKLQKAEQEKGQTKIVQVTKYSGLIGKVLDLSGAVFTGYEPVKKIELATPEVDEAVQARTQSGSADNLANVYSDWVEEHPEEVAELNTDTHELDTDLNGLQIGADDSAGNIEEQTAETEETIEIEENPDENAGAGEASGGQGVAVEPAEEAPVENPTPEPAE